MEEKSGSTHPVCLRDPLWLGEGLQPALEEGLGPPGGVGGLTLPADDKGALGTDTDGTGSC